MFDLDFASSNGGFAPLRKQQLMRNRWRQPLAKLSAYDLGFVVGLLEGEGSFLRAKGASLRTPCISCAMTDKDVIVRLHRVLGTGRVRGPYQPKGHRRPVYVYALYGERAYELMVRVLSKMSRRRRSQIQPLIKAFESVKPYKIRHVSSRRVYETFHIVPWAKARGLNVRSLRKTLDGDQANHRGYVRER